MSQAAGMSCMAREGRSVYILADVSMMHLRRCSVNNQKFPRELLIGMTLAAVQDLTWHTLRAALFGSESDMADRADPIQNYT